MFRSFKLVSQYIGPSRLKSNWCQIYSRHFSILYTKLKEPILQCQYYKLDIHPRRNLIKKAAHLFNTSEIPLLDKTIAQLFDETVATWPEQFCIISHHQNVRLTFSEVSRRVNMFAAGLKKIGLKKGDRIAIWGPNDLEWYITFLSAMKIGLITVAVNPAYQQSELVYCLQKVNVKAVVSPDIFKTQNYPKMLTIAKEICPTLEYIIIYSEDHVTGTRRFADVEALPTKTEVEAIAAEQSEISCYDGCNIQFTSGSTGKPKATFLSQRSILNNSHIIVMNFAPNTRNTICCNVPFFHAFGLLMAQLYPLFRGDTIVLESRSFNPAKTLEVVAKEKCNIMYGTPTMWINLLDAQQRLQLPIDSLQNGIIGGAPCSPELVKRIRDLFHFDITSLYGLTETSGVLFQTKLGDGADILNNYVGQLMDHLEVMIVNEKGLPVSFGTPGELWVRGYCNMISYFNDEENTKKIITSEGWLKTGDQFVLQENGYGNIIGRLKDILIRGGENIFPKEIEDFLMTHPKILEAHVIGAYDKIYGEEICACVQLRHDAKLTKEELLDYCKGKIAHFKIPRYIEFVNEYPKTVSGKIQKFRLKEQLESAGVIPVSQ